MDKQQLAQAVDTALDDIRPHLKVDGGDVEVVEVTDDNIARIKWLGNCSTCKMSFMTMRAGIEETLRHKVPEIQGVEAVNGVQVA